MKYKGKKSNGISITAKAVIESRDPGAINKISVCLSDELDVDLDKLKNSDLSIYSYNYTGIALYFFVELYEYAKIINKSIYPRGVVFNDPVEGCSPSIKIRMQRYQKKEEVHHSEHLCRVFELDRA